MGFESPAVRLLSFSNNNRGCESIVSILIDKNTKVITQGITGKTALFHAKGALDYGTQMVGELHPAKVEPKSKLRLRTVKPSNCRFTTPLRKPKPKQAQPLA